jgi:hypothetical protein
MSFFLPFGNVLERFADIGLSAKISLVFIILSSSAQAMVAPQAIHAYELAYQQATIIVKGEVVSYDIKRGAMLRVREVVRGDAQVGNEYLLEGSARYPFLAPPHRDITVFIKSRDGDTLHLWQEPTSGGLIWSELGLLERIARAQAEPGKALRSSEPRERLAGAYYLSVAGASSTKPTMVELDAMVKSVAWGLSHGSPSTHQAAVEIISALGYPLEKIGIAYNPGFKQEFKQAAGEQLLKWWARQHK